MHLNAFIIYQSGFMDIVIFINSLSYLNWENYNYKYLRQQIHHWDFFVASILKKAHIYSWYYCANQEDYHKIILYYMIKLNLCEQEKHLFNYYKYLYIQISNSEFFIIRSIYLAFYSLCLKNHIFLSLQFIINYFSHSFVEFFQFY